ncbi:unnamed protein product [Amoebophrya sp. A120]|nr:unnamed protein product [Amoebophrya sp. A120]|eukprot:GSA120T00016634001.1
MTASPMMLHHHQLTTLQKRRNARDAKREVQELKSNFQVFKSQVKSLLENYNRFSSLELERQLAARLLRSEQERLMYKKMLHNLKGSIRVFCRVRPELQDVDPPYSRSSDASHLKFVSEKQLEVHSANSDPKMFFFDRIFAPPLPEQGSSSGMSQVVNQELFEAVNEEILAAFDGQNVALIAYGATGTGKTYSCNAIMEKTIKEIDKAWKKCIQAGEEMEIEAQLVEIYNENIRDLLDTSGNGTNGSSLLTTPAGLPSHNSANTASSLKIVGQGASSSSDDNYATTEVQGAKRLRLDNARIQSSLARILKLGHDNRATFATNVHEHSSRSHLILTLWITTYTKSATTCSPSAATRNLVASGTTGAIKVGAAGGATQLKKTGKLSFVDLAGSERVKKSEVTGDRLKEAQYINKSLSALQDVIWAFERKIAHIPYRNSKLTHLLQDSLGKHDGNSRTVILITLSPSVSCQKETLQTLQFGSRLNSVNFSAASKRGAESVEQNRLKSMLVVEKKEKETLQTGFEKLRRDYEIQELKMKEKDTMIRALKQQVQQVETGSSRPSNYSTPIQFPPRSQASPLSAVSKFVSPRGATPGSSGTNPSSGSRGPNSSRPSPTQDLLSGSSQFGGSAKLHLVDLTSRSANGYCTPAFPSSSSSSSHVTNSSPTEKDEKTILINHDPFNASASGTSYDIKDLDDPASIPKPGPPMAANRFISSGGFRMVDRNTIGAPPGDANKRLFAGLTAVNQHGQPKKLSSPFTTNYPTTAMPLTARPSRAGADGISRRDVVLDNEGASTSGSSSAPRAKSSSPAKNVSPRALTTRVNRASPMQVGGVFKPRNDWNGILAGSSSSASSSSAVSDAKNAVDGRREQGKPFYTSAAAATSSRTTAAAPNAVGAASTEHKSAAEQTNSSRPADPAFHFYSTVSEDTSRAGFLTARERKQRESPPPSASKVASDEGFLTARGSRTEDLGEPNQSQPAAQAGGSAAASATSTTREISTVEAMTAAATTGASNYRSRIDQLVTPATGGTTSASGSATRTSSGYKSVMSSLPGGKSDVPPRTSTSTPGGYNQGGNQSGVSTPLVPTSVARSSLASSSARKTPQQPRFLVQEISSRQARELVKDYEPDNHGSPALMLKEAPRDRGLDQLHGLSAGNMKNLLGDDRTSGSAGAGTGTAFPSSGLIQLNNPDSAFGLASAGGVNKDLDTVSLSSTESDIKERLQFLLDIDGTKHDAGTSADSHEVANESSSTKADHPVVAVSRHSIGATSTATGQQHAPTTAQAQRRISNTTSPLTAMDLRRVWNNTSAGSATATRSSRTPTGTTGTSTGTNYNPTKTSSRAQPAGGQTNLYPLVAPSATTSSSSSRYNSKSTGSGQQPKNGSTAISSASSTLPPAAAFSIGTPGTSRPGQVTPLLGMYPKIQVPNFTGINYANMLVSTSQQRGTAGPGSTTPTAWK